MDAFFQFFNPADPWDQFLRICSAIFGNLLLRYIVFAGLAFLVFYRLLRKRWRQRKIQERFPEKEDYRRELGYSLVTILIFALFGYAVFSNWLRPHTRIYLDVDQFGWPYLFFSVVLMIVLHDAYFYWTHRLMHTRLLFRRFHAVHHESTNPSPWAAFSFHPLEALVEAGIIFPIVFLIPSHPLALLQFMAWMTLFNVLGHVGYEFFPRWVTRNPLARWLNTSTSHNLHHSDFRSHYTLYFRFWDVICRTDHRDYLATLERLQSASNDVKNRPTSFSSSEAGAVDPAVREVAAASSSRSDS